MIPPLDLASLSPAAQRVAGAAAPAKVREMAARGIAPGLRPAEVVLVLLLLTKDEVRELRESAAKTLAALPEPVLSGALSVDLPAAAIDALATAYAQRVDVVEKLLRMPELAADTLEELARNGSEPVTELIATNEQRLLVEPRAIELLYLNRNTRMSTADRLIDLAVRNGLNLTGLACFKEAAAAIQDELLVDADGERTPDDLLFLETQALADQLADPSAEDVYLEDETGEEVLKEKFAPLYKRIGEMSVSQKVRRAMLGTKEERGLLVRDRNRIVCSAAVRSPMIQEDEVLLMSRNRNLPEEVLRILGTSPEWTKSYIIKRNLVENAKTPAALSTRLVTQLRESDLKMIAKSKNVTGAVRDAARRHLDRRKT